MTPTYDTLGRFLRFVRPFSDDALRRGDDVGHTRLENLAYDIAEAMDHEWRNEERQTEMAFTPAQVVAGLTRRVGR